MTGGLSDGSVRLVDVGVAPTIVGTPDGPVVVCLPDVQCVTVWSNLEKLLIEAASGHPTEGVELPGPGAACRCGVTMVGELRIRHADGKLLCVGCSARPVAVNVGDQVAFRLASSDLFQYVAGGCVEQYGAGVVLRGAVESVSVRYQEVAVRVPEWATRHTVDVTALVERPARFEDMSRFWPDLSQEQLLAAWNKIVEMDGSFTVTSLSDDEWSER